MTTVINLVTRRVTASAHVRHTVTAEIRAPRSLVSTHIPARRGPPGPKGPQGDPGTIGGENPIVFNGGNF